MAKPVVDGLEEDLEGQAALLRVAVTGSVGRELASRYGVRAVPTFVLFDGAGEVQLVRAGTPDRDEIATAVQLLLED